MSGRNVSTRVVAFLLALVMCIGLMPLGALTARAETEAAQLTAALEEAKGYINSITINNTANDPATVVGNFGTHFTWDNEKRENSKSYLFDWSYYNGVVFEGLEYLYEVTGEAVYKDYVVEYMSTMINATGNWATCANNSSKEAAGYNSTHGADCYKTASLLLDAYAMTGDDRYLYTAKRLYADLDTAANTYLLANAGNNFRHTWASDSTPDLWLDGLYMILPFRAEYAKYTNDQEELDLIASRLQWVSDNMYNADKGLFYHAADSAASNSGTYWLRSIGWYAAALVDVMDSMSGQNLQNMKAQLVKLVDGMKACQNTSNGMWVNDMAKGQSSSNPYETSGTALTCYAIMKAVNNGWLDESYADMAILAFKGICNEKLDGNNLKDICFKGVPGGNNSTYYDNEGKGLGPFIMFYAEVLEYVNNNTQEPEAPAPSEPAVKDQTVTAGSISANVAGVSGELTGAALSDGDKALLDAKNYAAYMALDVNGTVAAGETAEVTFAIPGGWDAARVVGIHIENGAVVEIPGTVSGGRFTFAVSHFSGVGIALLAAGDNSVSGEGQIAGSMTVTKNNVTTLTEGYYLIRAYRQDYTLTGSKNGNRLTLATNSNVSETNLWYITPAGNDTYYVQHGGSDGQYLTVGNETSGVTTQTALTLKYGETYSSWGRNYTRNAWTIKQGSVYLNQWGGQGGTTAGGYGTGASDEGSCWYLYPVTVSASKKVTFSITPDSVTLAPNDTLTLTGTVTVAGEVVDLSKCTIAWASNTTGVATVSGGTVRGVADGSANITATLSKVDGTNLQQNIVLTIPVTVQSHQITLSTRENEQVQSEEMTLKLGAAEQLPVYVTFDGETAALDTCQITWTSSNENAVTVDETGKITVVGPGEAVITAQLKEVGDVTVSGKSITYNITVPEPVITFSTEEENTSEKEASLSLVVGENQTLTPYVTIDGQPVSLEDCEIEWSTGNGAVATCVDGLVNAITASNESVPITATLTKVNDYTLPTSMTVTYHVTVVNKAIRNAYLSNMEGYVIKNSGMNTIIEDANGSEIYVIIEYEDGTMGTAALTLDMIDRDGVNMTVAGVHNDRLVTYKGFEIPGFQLNVLGNPGNNFPKYPEPGSLRVNKVIGDGSQFQDTGVTEIQLSTSGLPVPGGVDVILIADISNSMNWLPNTTGTNDGTKCTSQNSEGDKWDVMQESVTDFVSDLLWSDQSGNTVTFVTFGGYDAQRNTAPSNKVDTSNYFDSVQTVFVGEKNAAAATSTIDKIDIYGVANGTSATYYVTGYPGMEGSKVAQGGTNYDYAFLETASAVNTLKAQYQAENGITYEESGREIHIIFLTDGAPDHYNQLYYKTRGDGTFDYYAQYVNSSDVNAGFTNYLNAAPTFKFNTNYTWNQRVTNGYYIPGSNMSQADWTSWIKSAPLNAAVKVSQIEGVEKITAIGFDLDKGGFGNWTFGYDDLNAVLENLAGPSSCEVILTEDESELKSFYDSMASSLLEAATEAYYVDQLSDSFNLQMANSVTKFKGQVDANGNSIEQVITLTPSPRIQISTYNIYKKTDVGAHTFTPTADMVGYMYYGVQITNAMVGKSQTGTVTEAMVGERYGASEVMETVTFSADGTKAYSNLIGNGQQDILGADGVIDAKYFWYNTKISPVTITMEGGSTFELDSETFRWNIGTINDKEFVLSYYAYLDGAVEGNVPAGSYKTNNYAELHYVNWLDNHVTKETVSPQVAWQSAQVSVAFYLVDADGNPMTNISTEATGSFYDAIKLTTPVVFDTVNLNSTDTITIRQDDLDDLLHGYTLYDPASVYQIVIDSDNEDSQWTIAKGAGKVDSVYVTNFYGAYASNIPNSNNLPWSSGVDYTNTVAWFAVKYEASTVPDVVVIDYGLPVDIDVLHNDMLNETAELVGVGQYNNDMSFVKPHDPKTLGMTYAQKNTQNPDGANYGTAQVYGNKVRYTLGTMSVNSYEHFAYEVHQEVSGADQYYYGSVKVIPATTVYYEDSFVDLSVGEWRGTGWGPQDGNGDAQFQWTKVANSNRTQAEDRPGQHSLPEIDADNLYGYDGAYSDVAKYSMNGYAKVNVDYDHIAYAEFDFYGTGYDVISLTSSATGTIIVDTYEYQTSGDYSNVTPVKSFAVDTYYGYTREFYEVTYTYDAASGTWEPKEETKVDTLGTSDKKPDAPNNGDTYSVYETRWIPSPNSDSIYQVPVMKVENLTYGRYHAKIQVFYDPFFDHVTGSADYDFYLDAIRIYDPAGNVYANTDDTTIKDAYIADGEGWPMYFELRNHILSVDSFSKAAVELLGQDNRMTGAVFIDGNEAVGDAQIADYKNFGPNNELYLAAGQDVAFILNLDKYCTFDATGAETGTIVASVQLGIKSATGEEVNYTICNINERGEYYAAEAYTLKTSTDMYYNITDYRGDVIVISNTDAEEILSITNIKVTFTQNPTEFNSNSPSDEGGNVTRSVQTFSLSASSDGQINAIDEDGQEEVGLIYMTYNATQRTLKALNERSLPDDSEEPEDVPTEPTVPEPTEPEATEPEATEPEATEPEATEPTEPEETKPKPPKPTEPKPTKPNKPTVPEEIKPKPNTKPEDTKPKPSKPEKKPAVTTPAEPEAFEPRFLDLFVSDSSVKVGEKVVVTVITSAEVESLTVNGHEVKRYVESGWLVKTRTWIVTLKASQAGEMQIDVVAYDQESVASGTERATVEVREKKPGATGKTPGKKHN